MDSSSNAVPGGEWFLEAVKDIASDFDDLRSKGESFFGKLVKDEDFLELGRCSDELTNLGISFYSEISKDEHAGFLAVNRTFSELSSVRQRIEDSITKLVKMGEEKESKATDWLSNHRIHLLGIIYRMVSDAVDYVKKVAGKLGISSFSVTTGLAGFSITFDFDIPAKNE